MVGTLCHLALVVSLAASPQDLTKGWWDSINGLYRVKVLADWTVQQRTSSFFEDVRIGPKREPAVSLTILTRRHFKPMTSIDNDRHLRTILAEHKQKYTAVRIEKGPNRVPVGNEDSWGYLLIYNTKATDGSKVSVRETINYVNRRLGDLAYVHHIIIGQVPLPVAFEYSAKLASLISKLEFVQLKVDQPNPKVKPAPVSAPGGDEEEDENTPVTGASASPGKPAAGTGRRPAAKPSAEPSPDGGER